MRRKKRSKNAKHFLTQCLFSDGIQHGHNLLHKLNIEDDSGFKNFVRVMKNAFEILFQIPKERYKISQSDFLPQLL
jgi:hypothetical protein